jgi:hypothetical protein
MIAKYGISKAETFEIILRPPILSDNKLHIFHNDVATVKRAIDVVHR